MLFWDELNVIKMKKHHDEERNYYKNCNGELSKLKIFLKDHLSHDNLAVTYQKFLTEINPDIILIKQI